MNTKAQYKGKRKIIDATTGEVMTAEVINKQVPDFWRFNFYNLLKNLGCKSKASFKVISYLLRHTSPSSNCVPETNKEIQKHSGVGYTTVSKTIHFLAKNHIIQKKPGKLMFNPNILAKGSTPKVGHLIINWGLANGKYKSVSNNANQTAKARKVLADKRAAKKEAKHKSNRIKSLVYAVVAGELMKHPEDYPDNPANASHNAKDLMANAKKARQLSMFGSHQNYTAKKSSLYSNNNGKQKTAQK